MYSSWWALRRQVPAGLNFALSGYPYWTTDIGGYHPLFAGQSTQPAYQELYARWFEYGAFCPVFRTHGHRDANELWTYDKVFPALLAVDRLRYRLLPYVYSLAWKVTSEDYTIQRPLVMDFRQDPATWEIGDQFMFGPALLVSPVLTEGATQRTLYLPAGTRWYDFWTGKHDEGGATVYVDAPLDRIPLAVRAGSILPLGPAIEYAGQATDPIELRVYPGADADFTLYEDEGDSYRLRARRARDHPDPLERCHAYAHHWRAPGQLSRHGCRSHFQCGDSFCRARRGRGCDGLAGQDGPIHRHER